MVSILLQTAENDEDRQLIGQLYRQYHRLMHQVAFDILKDHGLAEDAVHDAFLNVIQKNLKIIDIECPKTRNLVVIIVRNICFNMLRKRRRELQSEPEEIRDPGMAVPERYLSSQDVFFQKYEVERIAEVLQSLPPAARDAMYLYCVAGKSVKEIGALLGITEPAARKRIQRSREMIRQRLEEPDERNE